eukprot:CAMPEP_0181307904 /NCGR_PEP_ID=MMETSP1101-20121128/11150_1 /TAXON_ID=46948 /ORGANISM="Rhodomonas abbreviata, Strain Caron Lab Isolate" /LENGTH=58 /DNA_ID=CAMNT_0023414195 /DNA_START=70 /DNA_END=242 /DNA_ORIENTATION=+
MSSLMFLHRNTTLLDWNVLKLCLTQHLAQYSLASESNPNSSTFPSWVASSLCIHLQTR